MLHVALGVHGFVEGDLHQIRALHAEKMQHNSMLCPRACTSLNSRALMASKHLRRRNQSLFVCATHKGTHLLLLLGVHGSDLQVHLEVKRLDGLKALAQVRLHGQWVLRLTEDLRGKSNKTK